VIYCDSSFTASLYALDSNTKRANQIYQSDGRRPLFFTEWQELELLNTLRLGLYRAGRAGVPEPYSVGNCRRRIAEDLRHGILCRVKLNWSACVRRASKISEDVTQSSGVVMLDIWHIACAIELQAAAFWTFDSDQEKLARATGEFERVVGLRSG
jgi:predicted nucleic acid-binding protein